MLLAGFLWLCSHRDSRSPLCWLAANESFSLYLVKQLLPGYGSLSCFRYFRIWFMKENHKLIIKQIFTSWVFRGGLTVRKSPARHWHSSAVGSYSRCAHGHVSRRSRERTGRNRHKWLWRHSDCISFIRIIKRWQQQVNYTSVFPSVDKGCVSIKTHLAVKLRSEKERNLLCFLFKNCVWAHLQWNYIINMVLYKAEGNL